MIRALLVEPRLAVVPLSVSMTAALISFSSAVRRCAFVLPPGMDTLKGQIAYNNDGMRASYRVSNHSFNLLARNGVRIEGNTVTQNGEPLFKIHRRHAARKTQGCLP